MTVGPIHHTNISVTDLERSIAFYRDVLGYRVTMLAPVDKPEFRPYMHVNGDVTGQMAMLMVGDDVSSGMLELIQWDPPVENPTPIKTPGDPGILMIALEIKDETLEEARDRFKSQGVEIYSDVVHIELEGYPAFEGFIIKDPDGVQIELIKLPTADEVRAFRKSMHEKAAATAGDAA